MPVVMKAPYVVIIKLEQFLAFHKARRSSQRYHLANLQVLSGRQPGRINTMALRMLRFHQCNRALIALQQSWRPWRFFLSQRNLAIHHHALELVLNQKPCKLRQRGILQIQQVLKGLIWGHPFLHRWRNRTIRVLRIHCLQWSSWERLQRFPRKHRKDSLAWAIRRSRLERMSIRREPKLR